MSRTSRLLARLMSAAARRPLLVVVLTGLLAVAGGVLALERLEPQTTPDTLVGRGTPEYAASADYAERFGDDAVYVLVREPVTQLVLTSDLLRLISLEGCLGGVAPKDATVHGGPSGPCAALAKMKPARVVFGPGTFVNESVRQIQDAFTRRQDAATKKARSASAAARKLAAARGYSPAAQDRYAKAAEQAVGTEFQLTYAQLALKYGLTQIPQVNDPGFVSQLVFEGAPAGTPKSKFAYLFPARDAGLIQVRLKPELTTPERKRAIELIRAATRMPDWRLPNGHGSYVVTGAPVVVADLTDSISRSIVVLLAAALVVMVLVLAAVFRTRLRLLPLLVAATATALTFGGLALLGRSLTIATIAVLPVLIGLAVDYAIQLQSRVQEEQRAGRSVAEAVRVVARVGAPTVLTAAAASAAGFLVLLLSPVPMVRGFGVLLVAGIAIAFGLALTLGTAVLALGEATAGRRRPGVPRLLGAVGPSVRGAGELVLENRAVRRARVAAARGGRGALATALARPGRVLLVAAGVAVLGWGLGTQARVESDIQRLVPQDLPALSDLRQLQDATGVGGEVDVVISSDRLTEPRTLAWMTDYQRRVLARARYSGARGCGTADLCPALSLPDLFSGGAARTQAGIDGLLDAVPAYFSQGVITRDRRTASLAFGIRLMSVADQAEVVDMMRAELDPPPGVRAQLAGLPVLTAAANAKASSPLRRAELLLAGLAAVALVLLLALRSARRALLPLIPIALATGWSGLVLFAIRIDLNPMSVTLGALVIAISTEFSVLLSERYRAERRGGHAPREALRRTYASTGAAVLASGVTALAGFAVLVLSDIRMLRDFGAVTVVDLAVSLVGVLVVLPAVLMLDERGALSDLAGRLRGARPRLRRPGRRGDGDAPADAGPVATEPPTREPAPA